MLYYSIENPLANKQVNFSTSASSPETNILNWLMNVMIIMTIGLIRPLALVYCMIWGWNNRNITFNSIAVIVLFFQLGSFSGCRTSVDTLVQSCFSPARKATDFVRNARLFSVKTSLAFCLNAYCVLPEQALDTGNIQALF